MHIYTSEGVAARAAEAWKRQYFHERDGWHSPIDHDAESTYNALLQLGPNPNPEDVDRITDGGGWATPPMCSECKQHHSKVIMLGEEPDYDSATVWICSECLSNAAAMMKN